MAQKYTVYRLKKVKGKKEYVVDESQNTRVICNSLSSAYRKLQEFWDDCLDGPVWYNRKINDAVAYEMHDRMLYVPNEKEIQGADGVWYNKLIGVYGRQPIYYIDVYPNPYTRYVLHKKGDEFQLEGIIDTEPQ